MRLLKNTTHGPRVTISPIPNGTATEFTASHGIAPGTSDFICVYLNGVLQHEDAGIDYTLGSFQEVLKIKFNAALADTDILDFVFYGIGG